MKSKLTVTALVVAITVTSGAIVATSAQKASVPAEAKCLKIGVVSVRRIFQDSKRNVKYRQEASAERDKMEAGLQKLSSEIDLDKAEIRTLKQGSPDYSSRMKEILEKQGKLQAQQEYYKRQMDIQEQVVIEGLFKDVLQATADVAKEKGFDLVLEKSEPEFPATNSNELTLTISTHKVLYSEGCEDLTDAVLAKVDANTP
jgi:Skp family chaperone for outer membrane proteins